MKALYYQTPRGLTWDRLAENRLRLHLFFRPLSSTLKIWQETISIVTFAKKWQEKCLKKVQNMKKL